MSRKYSLNLEDAKKIAYGAIIAGIGASTTYVLQYFCVDFGDSSVTVSAIMAVIANIIRKYVSGE